MQRRRKTFSGHIPYNIQILTSDDVSEYVLDLRYLCEGLDARREDLFEEYKEKTQSNFRLKSLDDYDTYKESQMARRQSQSAFARYRMPLE